jgi:hypothetical protein
MKLLLLWLAAALPAAAHVISMSSGFANVAGSRVSYLLKMPSYEVQPGAHLLDHIRFTSGFETGRRIDGECQNDPSTTTVLCAADYQFAAPVERLGVECTFYEETVPNHIHLLRAEKNGKYDQAILDSTFPSATLTFRPPTAIETAVEQTVAGAMRVWRNLAQVLLLIALALAARSRPELAWLMAAFLAGECGGTAILLKTAWQPPLRFAEAAAALALAYLALEILAFPKARGRWLLAMLFGGFQAMFFALFVSDSGYRAGWVLAGACVAALAIGAVCGVPKLGLLVRRIGAGALAAVGVIWFVIRLRN